MKQVSASITLARPAMVSASAAELVKSRTRAAKGQSHV
jgi:hypothetical protein